MCGCGKATAGRRGSILSAASANRGRPLAPNGVNSSDDRQRHRQALVAAGAARQHRRLLPDLIALDVDVRHDGLGSLAALEDEYGKLPPTWTVITGRRRLALLLSPPRRPRAIPAHHRGEHRQERRRSALRRGHGCSRPISVAPPSRHITRRLLPVGGRWRSREVTLGRCARLDGRAADEDRDDRRKSEPPRIRSSGRS